MNFIVFRQKYGNYIFCNNTSNNLNLNYNIIMDGSFFYSEEDINIILDKISLTGYESLSDSDKYILENYSSSDKDLKNLFNRIDYLSNQITVLDLKMKDMGKKDKDKCMGIWTELYTEFNLLNTKIKSIYKLEDPIKIRDFKEKFMK